MKHLLSSIASVRSVRSVLSVLLVLCCVPAFAGGYRTAVTENGATVSVVVVWGTPHEMGFAQGRLMKNEAVACLKSFLGKAHDSHMGRLQDPYLDSAWAAVAPHTDKRFIEELDGVAEGAGAPIADVRRAHTIPVVMDYACSGVAVWGDMTKDHELYQFRNLDYTTDGGLQNSPTVVIYVPKEGIPHMNVTFAGCIGVNTGMNAEGIVLGEKGETPVTDFPYKLDGPHFMSFFQTLLYDAHSLDQALDIIKATTRIKKYYWFISDGKIPAAVKIKSFSPDLKTWKGGDPTDELAPRTFKNAIYQTMNNGRAFEFLTQNKGKMDAPAMIELSRQVASHGGNLLDAVYRPKSLELWVAYAGTGKGEPAAKQPYVHIDMKKYLDITKIPAGAKKLD